jgi:RNA polymerase sigma factor (TIGR02999 family)
MRAHDEPLTVLLRQAAQGDRRALDRVFELLYPDLRRIAHARLRTQDGVAYLNTTALVHESFLRLVDSAALALTDRKHFFAYAAKTMRNIVVDFAREQLAQRRGGGQPVLRLESADSGSLPASEGDASLLAINEALTALEELDPPLAEVVEMRYFAGYNNGEIAELTGRSERTVRRQWDKARAFLLATIQE